ncbi:MAG: ABC transporter permease subunit [Bacillota bacterium]|nr:ABC transporter permease subunit [Bacillota bacterium]
MNEAPPGGSSGSSPGFRKAPAGAAGKSRLPGRRQILIILFWLVMWQVLCLIIDREIYFPSPASTFAALWSFLPEAGTWTVIGHSILRTVLALLFSALFGVSLGLLAGRFHSVYELVNPLVVVLRSTPVVSIIIIAIIWFRSTNVPVFAGFLMCFPILFTGTVAGIRSTDVKLLELCQVYRISPADRLRSVYLPSARPYINAAMVSAIGIGWKAVAAAEVLSMPAHSIGAELFFAKTTLDPASLFAWTIVIIILSYLFETLYARVSGYDKTGKRM